jgi:hypothetical protein
MQNRARALNEERPALRKTRGPRVTPRSCNRRVFAYITRQRLRGLGPAPWWRWTGSHLPPALGMRGNYSYAPIASSALSKKQRLCGLLFRHLNFRHDFRYLPAPNDSFQHLFGNFISLADSAFQRNSESTLTGMTQIRSDLWVLPGHRATQALDSWDRFQTDPP